MFIFDLVLIRGKLTNPKVNVMKEFNLSTRQTGIGVADLTTSKSFIAFHFPKSPNTFRFPVWVR